MLANTVNANVAELRTPRAYAATRNRPGCDPAVKLAVAIPLPLVVVEALAKVPEGPLCGATKVTATFAWGAPLRVATRTESVAAWPGSSTNADGPWTEITGPAGVWAAAGAIARSASAAITRNGEERTIDVLCIHPVSRSAPSEDWNLSLDRG